METAVRTANDITFFPDQDQDGITDSLDRDDDNDGLIEVATPQELNHIRYSLDGSGYKDGPDATKDTTGCPSAEGCHGYELVEDLDLSGYGDETKGWEPIGDRDNPFTARFDGNDYVISGLFINRPAEDDVALFGEAADVTISNVHLTELNVSGNERVGGIVGSGIDLLILSSSVAGTVTASAGTGTGGLVGRLAGTLEISSSYMVGTVNAIGTAGGLVGGHSSTLVGDITIFSSAMIGNVNGGTIPYTGGLVGVTHNLNISASYMIGTVNGRGLLGVGGLVGGVSSELRIEDSYSLSNVNGIGQVGGLVGAVKDTHLSSSYVAGIVDGNNRLGSLAGSIVGSSTSGEPSYWDSDLNGRTGPETAGTAQTTMTLQDPAAEIYTNWTATCPDDESIDVWDFGTDTEYPAINCSPLDPATQRDYYQQHLDNRQQ